MQVNALVYMYIGKTINITSFLMKASWTLLYIKSSAESSAGFYYSYVENNYGLLGLVAAGASLGAVITYPFLLLLGNTIAKKDELLISSFLYFSGTRSVIRSLKYSIESRN